VNGEAEVWARFAASILSRPGTTYEGATAAADTMLREFKERYIWLDRAGEWMVTAQERERRMNAVRDKR
jgi:hypothetical protein